jgi:Uma2 family endonuclease
MASVPQPRVSPEEYVELEQKLGLKHEYHDGQMFAMSGASDAHSVLQVNIAGEVGRRLRGSTCVARSSDFRVVIEAGDMATYPDLSVVCGPVQPSKRYRNSCTNPTVLVGVLSPSTERYDRGAKFEQYRKLESLREYVLVSQQEPSVDLFRLENGHWVLHEVRGESAVLELTSVGVEIPMSDLYYNVRFEDAEQG